MSYRKAMSSDLVKFEWVRLSPTPPSPAQALPLCALCDELEALGLMTPYGSGNPIGSNGNVSVRLNPEGGMLVTATQLPSKRGLQADDFVQLDRCDLEPGNAAAATAYYSGSKIPSSESILHWYFYQKRPAVNAIVHVHESTNLLYSEPSRKAWERMGVIETVRYGDAGTIDLPRSVEEVIEDLDQYVILKDHWPAWDREHTGTVVFASTLEKARRRVIEVHEGLLAANRSAPPPMDPEA